MTALACSGQPGCSRAARPAAWAGHRHCPGRGAGLHLVQQRPVGGEAVPQPQAGDGVALGEGPQEKEGGKRLQPSGQPLGAICQLQEALVHHQPDPHLPAPPGNGLQQLRGDGPPGGVVGGAEEEHVQVVVNAAEDVLRQVKAVLSPQAVGDDLRPGGPEGLAVFGEGGGGDHGPAGLLRPHQAEDQVGRARAAEHLLRLHAVPGGNAGGEFPAGRVGVVDGVGDGRLRRLLDLGRHAQGIEIGGEVQHRRGTAPDIAAVGVLHGGRSLLCFEIALTAPGSPAAARRSTAPARERQWHT